MQMYVRTLTGKTYVVDIEREDTLGTFKEALFDKTGFPPELQRLIYRGKQLDDDSKTLRDHGVTSDAEFSLVLRPPNSNREQESDGTGRPRPVDRFLPDRCQQQAKYCGYCGASNDHQHNQCKACTRPPMTLAIAFLGHSEHAGQQSPFTINLAMPLTCLVSELKAQLAVEIGAARARDVIDPVDLVRHAPCPFHFSLPVIARHHIVLLAHGLVMADDDALCDYSLTEGRSDLSMAFDLKPQPYGIPCLLDSPLFSLGSFYNACAICGEVYNVETQSNHDCRRTIRFNCPVNGDELTLNDPSENEFDLLVALANGDPGDSMEMLMENGQLFRCEVPPKEYQAGVQKRRQIFARTSQLNLEDRVRFRAVLTADEWALIEARREGPAREFQRRTEEAEDKRAGYMLSHYLHCHVFGAKQIFGFDFYLWAKSQYASFYFWMHHRNEHGCSGSWDETILGRELGRNRAVRLEFLLPTTGRYAKFFLWLYDAAAEDTKGFVEEMKNYLSGDVESSEVQFVFILGLNLSGCPVRHVDSIEELTRKMSTSYFKNATERYTDERLQKVVKSRLSLYKGHQAVGFQPPHVSIFHVPSIQSLTALSFVIDSIAREMEPLEPLERAWKSQHSKMVYDFEAFSSSYSLDDKTLTKEQASRNITEAYQLYFGFWHDKVQPVIDSGPWFDVWPHVRFFFELRRFSNYGDANDVDGNSESFLRGNESFGSLPLEVGAIVLFSYMAMNSLAHVDWKRII